MAGPTEQERNAAREHVRSIAKRRGWVSKESRQVLAQLASTGSDAAEAIQDIEESNQELQEGWGSAIETLANNLYSSNARFVPELIQNAEDCSYERATKSKSTPYILFAIHPDRVIVECNEDGFTFQNVESICMTGDSSKAGSSGYIGEKGIGFKSVFMVASKVFIQSGAYSFYFEYNGDSITKGKKGIGMITPVWVESDSVEESQSQLTRITLMLRTNLDFLNLLQQFADLHDTLLLFLKKIKKISIDHYDESGRRTSSTNYRYQEDKLRNKVTLTKFTGRESTFDMNKTERYYYMVRRTATDLPMRGKGVTGNAEVVLAFPITFENTPMVEHQHVYAFLPIRDFGFSFLIQSDFETQASREDIVESARNVALLDHVAETFGDAVKIFRRDTSLQYLWMDWLPNKSVTGTFWTALLPKIESRLMKTRFLRAHSPVVFYYISQIRHVPEIYKDRDGQPLFDDLPTSEQYLESGYERHLTKLKSLGLMDLSGVEMIERVKADAEKINSSGTPSRLATMNSEDDWHVRVANLLRHLLKRPNSQEAKLIRKIPLIPLTNGNWKSATASPIYYANMDSISIPEHLGLSLVNSSYFQKNSARKSLFDDLGVTTAPGSVVRDLILEAEKSHVTLSESLAHLQYLWWTHHFAKERNLNLPGLLKVHTHRLNQRRTPSKTDIYFDSVRKLLVSSDSDGDGSDGGDEAGRNSSDRDNGGNDDTGGVDHERGNHRNHDEVDSHLYFLHPSYEHWGAPDSDGIRPTWKRWLRDHVGIQNYPPLSNRHNPEELSKAFQFIAEHRPEKLVVVLKKNWSQYSKALTEEIKVKIANIDVGGAKMYTELKKAYLPLDSLKKACKTFAVLKDFPFLELPGPTKGDISKEWGFLTRFGVGTSQDIKFYLQIFRCTRDFSPNEIEPKQVYHLCETIQYQLWGAENATECNAVVYKYFNRGKKVFFPPVDPESPCWFPLEDCLWEGPSYMNTKFPLHARCSSIGIDIDKPALKHFFCETLRVPNVTWQDLVDELEEIQESENVSSSNVQDIYRLLYTLKDNDDWSSDELRDRFETAELIYIPAEVGAIPWHRPSSCLWSSMARISGKITIGDVYPELENFFTGCLRVTAPSIDMLLDELTLLAEHEPSETAVKDLIFAINSLLPSQTHVSSRNIEQLRIFPVNTPGGFTFRSKRLDFAIVDRQSLFKAFETKASILAFKLEEVRILKPFFSWLKLEDRYLSRAVKEITRNISSTEKLSSKLTRNFRQRARCLFRCAVHYGSPWTNDENDQSLYQLIAQAELYETDGISSNLILFQNGKDIEIRGSSRTLHIERIGEQQVKIYVPRDPVDQELCYESMLPERLLSDLIMKDPSTGFVNTVDPLCVRVLVSVLKSSPDILNDLLERFGIVQVNIRGDTGEPKTESRSPRATERSVSPSTTRTFDDDSGINTPRSSSAATESTRWSSTPFGIFGNYASTSSHRDRRARPPSSMGNTGARGARTPSIQGAARPDFGNLFGSPRTASPDIEPESQSQVDDDDEDDRYRKILDHVIKASETAVFPSSGAFNFDEMRNALPSDEPDGDAPAGSEFPSAFGIRSVNQLKHDMKIGAAGELFIFEILSNLRTSSRRLFDSSLLGIGYQNWHSSIRHLVKVHEKYADMPELENPYRREEADIVYEDTAGKLTEILIDNGYLDSSIWRMARPKYFIEVKTTRKKCSTKFFMSRSQYLRMKRMAFIPGRPVPEVYMIFRVYNLGRDDIGLCIYVNPEQKRKDKELTFRADAYAVTPNRTVENA